MTDQNYVDALKATCGLPGCASPPGEPCVNSANGRGPRDEPHWNRVARARRLGDVSTAEWRAVMGVPPLMPGGEVMSAQLRQTQSALAASQADLTRTEQERDAVGVKLVAALRDRDKLADAVDGWVARFHAVCESEAAAGDQIDLLRADLTAEAGRARDLAIAELATASKEVKALRAARQWIVARDGGRHCVRCEQEIRRGEAYELLPGVDELRHIHCPTEGEPT